jgi:hypothetical protein
MAIGASQLPQRRLAISERMDRTGKSTLRIRPAVIFDQEGDCHWSTTRKATWFMRQTAGVWSWARFWESFRAD